MSKQAKPDAMNPFTLEEALAQHYNAEPSAAFLDTLEQKLLAQQARHEPATVPTAAPSFWQALAAFFRPRPALVVALLLLILLTPLLLIGPQRAWAGLQAWLGYVPGVGFIDLENTRVLLAPAEQTRDGVTLRVAEAIAGPQETTLVIESSGLPPEDTLWGNDGAQVDDAFAPVLRLPDGTGLNVQTFTLRLGRGTLVFPPLPPDVYHVNLDLPLLPLVPPGAVPENWSLPLLLQPATGELVAAMYPQPYSPQGASDTHHGITLSVLEVAHTPQQTVFTVQTQWQDKSWAYAHPQPAYHSLYDDVGHIYGDYVEPGSGMVTTMVQRVQPGEAPPPQTSQLTFDFGPLSLAAGEMTFEVPEVEVMLPAEDTFTIDLGQHPQVGDSWDLDMHLDVAGFPVHITRAWIDIEQIGPRGDREQRTNLYFHLEPVAPQEHRRLLSFGLTTAHPAFQGSGGSGLQLRHLTLADGAELPSGPLTVQVIGATVAFSGPWTLTWDVPDAPGLAPTRLEPNQATTANGISLRLDEVALTDRVTAVAVMLEDAPEGAALADILPGIPGERRRLVLEDDRLHDYWFEGGNWLWWQPLGPAALSAPPGPGKWLPFPPLQPLTHRLSLQIPTLLLARPDPAAFTFTVVDPQSLAFTPDPQGHGGQHSEPWPIDARASIAGYDIHFTEATLFESGPTGTNLSLTGLVTASDGRPPLLHELRVSAINGPDGDLLHGAAPSGATLSSLPTGVHSLARCDGRRDTCEVSLIFPIQDANTGLALPGSYEVTLEGVNELVQGPWTFHWSLQDTPNAGQPAPEAGGARGLVQPYAPPAALHSVHGVTLQILAVAHTEQETAVYARAHWQDALWEWRGFDDPGVESAPQLHDETGQRYAAVSPENRPLHVIREVIDASQTPAPTPQGVAQEDTAWFPPFAPTTQNLTLHVDHLWFSARPALTFTIDLGPDPPFGERWPLDVTFDIGGFPLRINAVRLEEGTPELPFKLVFETEVTQDTHRTLETVTVNLGRDVTDFGGAARSETARYTLAGELQPALSLAALPSGPFTLLIDNATMAVDGPWEMTWNVQQ